MIILNPKVFKSLEDKDKTYVGALIKELENQDIESKLLSYWTKRRLLSQKEKIATPPDQIRHLKEYLLLEIINEEERDHLKENVRENFIPKVLSYKVDRIDWIVFLIYQFLKKNKICIITKAELDRKIKNEIKSKITKKVWFPIGFYIIFVLVKLYLANVLTLETIGQIITLIIGTIFLFFEEKLPPFEIPVKRHKITFGQIGELLIILSILWALRLGSLIINLI